MDTVVFSMHGEPRGKGRPRTTTRGRLPVIYTDPLTKAYEKSVKDIATLAMRGHKPLEGPLSIAMRFRLSIPKSTTKRLRARFLSGEDAYLGSADVDNMIKSIADGMNGVVFIDDKQIVRLYGEKIASESAGVDVKVIALMPQPNAGAESNLGFTAPGDRPSQIVSTGAAEAHERSPMRGRP